MEIVRGEIERCRMEGSKRPIQGKIKGYLKGRGEDSKRHSEQKWTLHQGKPMRMENGSEGKEVRKERDAKWGREWMTRSKY